MHSDSEEEVSMIPGEDNLQYFVHFVVIVVVVIVVWCEMLS